MARYFVYEGNMEKLEKKLKTIENKCAKYDVYFRFEIVGHEFREIKDENKNVITVKYIEVEVEGNLRHENWEFIGTIDHHRIGNIIRQFNTSVEVPDRYRHTDPICEHCNTRRSRKFTYLVHNTETDEWKQVGRSCLKEFTKGLDAEAAAYMEQWFHNLEDADGCFTGISYDPRYSLKDILCYAKECVTKFGYVSTSDEDVQYGDKHSTKEQTWKFYRALELGGMFTEADRKEAEYYGIDAMTDENKQYVDDAIAWIRSNTEEDGYMFNLRVACDEDYIPFRNLGLAVSLMPTYYRHLKNLEYEEKKKKAAELESQSSQYQGTKGQRLTVKIESAECVCSFDGFYGMTYMYKFIDAAGNIYMWSTGKSLETDKITSITGTVKNHDEYRGVKQTHLTRCKVA